MCVPLILLDAEMMLIVTAVSSVATLAVLTDALLLECS